MTRNVLKWLEDSARRNPDAVAFEDADSALTYRQLHTRAREIGSFLRRRVPAQHPVLLYMEKGPACVAAILGCVYAGCFYTPVDPDMPEARLRRIAAVLTPARVLCDAKFMERAAALCPGVEALAVSSIPAEIDEAALASVRREAIDTDLLYVLFTSGSTGLPKGVTVTHRAVVDFVEWACEALQIDETCKFGNQAPLYFDNSVLDIYCALRMGACVHFIPQKYFAFPGKMPSYLTERRINTVFWVPSALSAVASSGILEREPPAGLERVFFCGEVMSCKTLNAWRRALPEARYVNMYGPTEITDVCTYFPVEREFSDADALPIGFPCANTRILLIDGEICVAGTCLSPGYYNAPERTREAFVPNPLRTGVAETIYRTGDLGTYNERGELMFLGRRDSQIKRRGYRIELGEIECALCAQEGVAGGCCVYDAGRERIICFYAGTAEEKALRRRLKEGLPGYMMPDVLVRREALPRTPNGKIDRLTLKSEWEHEHPVL